MSFGQPPKDNSYNNLVVRESLTASEMFAETLTLGNHTLNVRGTSNQIEFGDRKGPTVIFNVDTSQSATITFPNPGVDSSVVLTQGDQVINGAKILTNASIKFPTVGGTPTSLTYYEEFSGIAGMFSGPLFGGIIQNVNYTIVRTGRQCTFWFAGFTRATIGGAGDIITSNAPIPSQFLPLSDVSTSVVGYNNSAGANASITFVVQSNGILVMYVFPLAPFTNGGNLAGVLPFSTSWIVA
jgi:hypothetical protein